MLVASIINAAPALRVIVITRVPAVDAPNAAVWILLNVATLDAVAVAVSAEAADRIPV